ncbi:sigma-70 family RNA polymerase sigma factor [Brevundimonas vancanneytii]|uniref:Sigma-70 n=1 Tax=Brevundimonas vancanneytii TaxID=1325724 RepID=A0A4P1JT35_9CAUL|nr:sigma-70 family RNA polymerase sigma factor [Brevundimonas vancanneytii]VTO11287.1 Sigma-70 [Brevundimonas vancanneytii]
MEESLEDEVSQDDSRFSDDDELDADGAPTTASNADEVAAVVRPDVVARVFKSLSADAERGDGELQRADVNRTYLRRQLSVAECMEVEDQLAVAGFRLIEDDEDVFIRDEIVPAGGTARRRVQYLTDVEEKELGRRIQLALRLPENTYEDSAYVERVRRDADRAKATFVASNIHYVEMLARRRGERRHLTIDDLIQEGMIGLLRAADLYDPERGFRFKTYATWWIEQRMRRSIADGDRIVRLPVHLQERMVRIRRAQAKLTFVNGKPPTADQLAEALGVDPERLMKLMWHVQVTEVAEGDAFIGEDTTLLSILPDTAESAFDLTSQRELEERFGDVLATLSPREERILRMRFGIGLDSTYTLESVGQEYSVTRERIRQIEAKALGKLRHPTRSRHLRGFLDR